MAWAQEANFTDVTSTPVPGAGHDYIKGLNESVNPGNGSLSIHINIPLPAGRQLNIPFSINYDSTETNYPAGTSGIGWKSAENLERIGGWTYTEPVVTASTNQSTIQVAFNELVTCDVSINYMATDLTGQSHPLDLSIYGIKPGSRPYGQYNSSCSQSLYPDGTSPVQRTTGGDAPFYADTSADTSNGTSFQFNPVTMIAPDGTRITFPGGPAGDGTSYSERANQLEDRNGNIITVTATGTTGFYYTDTLGRTLLSVSSIGGAPDDIYVSGISNPYVVNWTNTNVSWNPAAVPLSGTYCTGFSSLSTLRGVISSIQLPNGQSYQFQYDGTYGFVSKIIYPSGGYVRYVWGLQNPWEVGDYSCGSYRYAWPVITDRYVSYDGTNEVLHQHFNYSESYTSGEDGYDSRTTTITTYDMARNTQYQTVYTYKPLYVQPQINDNSVSSNTVTLEQEIQYYNYNGNLLKTVNKTWGGIKELLTRTVQYNDNSNNPTREIAWHYDNNLQTTEIDNYDFGNGSPGALLRKKLISYASFGNNPWNEPSHIVDRPSQVEIEDGSGNVCSQTLYDYDQQDTQSTSGISQHDDTNYSSSFNVRGNLTEVQRWDNNTCSTSPGGNYLNTTITYDDTGQPLILTNPRGYQTSLGYADQNAYVSTFTDSMGDVWQRSYNQATGTLASQIDPNNQTTSFYYNDILSRLTEIDFPDSGKTTVAYDDTPGQVSTTVQRYLNGSAWTDQVTLYNGLGMQLSVSTANGEGSPWDRHDTEYDGDGRILVSGYAYQTGTSPTTWPSSFTGDTFTYDSLGRTTVDTHSDGTSANTTYSGRALEVSDEGDGSYNVTRISQINGLKQVLDLCEVTTITDAAGNAANQCGGLDITPSGGFLTTYGYDTLGNLISVTQNGSAHSLNPRTYSFDTLSRLISSTNPESGTTTYAYDGDSNCSSSYPGLLASQTDPRGIRTCFQYDPLNRVTQKSYSDGTASANFVYSSTNSLIGSYMGISLTNTIGRLAYEYTGTSPSSPQTAEVFSYDALGRIVNNSQCVTYTCSSGNFFPVSYGWDNAGELTSSTNGAGVSFTDAYNQAERLISLVSSIGNTTLISGLHYNAFGEEVSGALGSGQGESRGYDVRGRLTSMDLGSSVYTLSLSYMPNGTIDTADDSVNGNWTFSYDPQNRLSASSCSANSTANCPDGGASQGFSYSYDRYGNRWAQTVTAGTGPGPSNSFTGGNNHMDGYSYDAAGDLLSDGHCTYTYDGAGRISSVSSCASASYIYNASGQRVYKETGTIEKAYVVDLAANAVAHFTYNGTAWSYDRGEVYAGGRHLATYNSGTLYYNQSDWLGTERMRTTSSGTPCEAIQSLPYGDGQNTIAQNGGCGDPSPLHFTGKQRDAESGLDYFGARYNDSSLGRFMTPDPLNGKLGNGLSWNRYLYTLDNPVTFTDPTGMAPDLPPTAAGEPQETCGGTFECAGTSDKTDTNTRKVQKKAQQQLSQKGLEFIARHEGLGGKKVGGRYQVYKDAYGNPTVGYGHLVRGEDFSKGVTKAQALALLKSDAQTAVSFVNGHLSGTLKQTQFDSLVDVAFNSERAAAILIKRVNSSETMGPANFVNTLPHGYHSLPGLINRREDEANLFLNGGYQ